MTIYISLPNKITLYSKSKILLKDIGTICVCNGDENKVKCLEILEIDKNKDKIYCITLIDIVKKLKEEFGNIEVINLGRQNILIEYFQIKKKPNPIWEYSKILMVCCILFFGGATTIISFHIETQLIKTLEKFYVFFTGSELTNLYWLSIPYTIGIGLGIIIFFNHFGKFKITNDPSPVEIELTKYENELLEALVDKLNKGVNNA